MKGHAFTDFKDEIELQKINNVVFQFASYENETGCREFINSISDYFFRSEVIDKIKSVNFIGILCDGSVDSSVNEQEVIYVTFTDPDTQNPTLKFLHVVSPEIGQDAAGLKEAIKYAFEINGLENAMDKIVFFASDGASVNSGKESGLVRKLQEDYEWIVFLWCFSHRLELAIKEATKDYFEAVDESLRHLYYLHERSSKKHRELKQLYVLLQDRYDYYGGSGVKPLKSMGTRWLDHKLRATGRMIDKFALYTQHLQNFIESSKPSDRGPLQGKLNKLLEAQGSSAWRFFQRHFTRSAEIEFSNPKIRH